MSIRTKIVLILALGIGVSLAVTLLGYLSAASLDDELAELLDSDLGAVRALSAARDALDGAQNAETLMVTLQDNSLRFTIDRAVTVLTQTIARVRNMGVESDVLTYQSLVRDADAYARVADELVRTLNAGSHTIRDALAQFKAELRRLQSDIERISPSHTGEVQDALEGSLALIGELVDFQPQLTDVERGTAARYRRLEPRHRFLERALSHLISILRPVDEARARELARTTEGVTRTAANLWERLTETASQVRRQLSSARQLRGKLDVALTDLSNRAFRGLTEARAELRARRSDALTVSGIAMVVGLLIVVSLTVWVTRGVGSGFRELVRAAREVEQGKLDHEVRVAGRDELSQLATAFNAMAAYYADRRRQQTDYNALVSMLNRSMGLAAILAGSIREVVQRSGSNVGAVYLVDESGERLVLAEAYGLKGHATVYKLGEGLVGQAAQDREPVTIEPRPGNDLRIDTGLGLVTPAVIRAIPLVHLDRLLGVFILAAAREYSEVDDQFVTEAVFQVGVAINNARFVETIQATAAELRSKTKALIAQQGQLEDANEELARASQLQIDFLANMTHELRTPLNSIIGFTELVLAKSETLPERTRRHLSIVLRNATNLLRLINDLLDITKLEADKVKLILGPVDLTEIVTEVVQTVTPMVKEEVALVADIPDDAPELFSDAGRLRQVLLNLTGNAAKFTEKGEVGVRLRRAGDSHIKLIVSDSGIGIPERELPHIFDKFHQADTSSSRRYGGTGLGLAITSELVRRLGGTITAQSTEGVGSTFTVRLPIDIRTVEDDASERRLALGALDVEAPAAPRVLVLDARPQQVSAVRRPLVERGVEVVNVLDYGDAALTFDEVTPVALFLGEALPEDNANVGHRQLAALVARTSTPVVLLGEHRTAPLEGFAATARIVDAMNRAELLRVAETLGILAPLPAPVPRPATSALPVPVPPAAVSPVPVNVAKGAAPTVDEGGPGRASSPGPEGA